MAEVEVRRLAFQTGVRERPKRERPSFARAGLDVTIALSVNTSDLIDGECRRRNKVTPRLPEWTPSRLIEDLIQSNLSKVVDAPAEKFMTQEERRRANAEKMLNE